MELVIKTFTRVNITMTRKRMFTSALLAKSSNMLEKERAKPKGYWVMNIAIMKLAPSVNLCLDAQVPKKEEVYLGIKIKTFLTP